MEGVFEICILIYMQGSRAAAVAGNVVVAFNGWVKNCVIRSADPKRREAAYFDCVGFGVVVVEHDR